MLSRIVLKKKRERSVERCHPWIFSGAIETVEGHPEAGDTIEVFDADGHWLARASYSPQSQITCRILSRNFEEKIDRAFFEQRLKAALAYREQLRLTEHTNAYRLVHGEVDGLPGLVVDVYGGFYVCQFSTVAMERWKRVIAETLMTFPGARGVYDRSDVASRAREGLEPTTGVLAGEKPPMPFVIEEYGMKIVADIKTGHKTGFYLDQRDNRRSLSRDVHGLDVLNCFCYSGGFGVRMAMDGARSITQVDASEEALALARTNATLNNVPPELFTYIKADVFKLLRLFRDSRRAFDVIILDPPKFADTQGQLEKACRGYKDINLLALKLLRPGGTLMTFSCSAAMTPELFRKVVGDASRDAGRVVRVVRTLEQSADHPRSLDFPEGDYLVGLELSVE